MKSDHTLRRFTPEEAAEFKAAALSSGLRDDMRQAVALRKAIEKERPMDVDQYLEYLTAINGFMQPAPALKRITESFMVL